MRKSLALLPIANNKYSMDSNDETIIHSSKMKILLVLLGASAFVAAGIWMLSLDDASIQSQRRFNEPMFVRGLALVAIVFFGFFALFAVKKLFDKKPGLIFNRSGIVDNASSVSAGFIPWSEIEGAYTYFIQNQKMLILKVKDPEEYIARGSALKQKLNRANYKMVGSPISISSNTLAINFSDLVSLFDEYHGKYGAKPESAEMHTSVPECEVGSPEILGAQARNDDDIIKGSNLQERLLNWSPIAIRGTVGSGGIGILVLLLSSLDLIFRLQLPFWPAFIAALLPMFLFILAVPGFFPRRLIVPAQWFASIWYLVFAALSILLAAYRGLEGVDVLLVGFILVGALSCLVAIRKLRVAHQS